LTLLENFGKKLTKISGSKGKTDPFKDQLEKGKVR
jgi:hypothetical protein